MEHISQIFPVLRATSAVAKEVPDPGDVRFSSQEGDGKQGESCS